MSGVPAALPGGCRGACGIRVRPGRQDGRRGIRRGPVIALILLVVIGVLGYRSLGSRVARAVAPPSRARAVALPSRAQLGAGAPTAVNVLLAMYETPHTVGVTSWRAANMFRAMLLYMQASGSRAYLPQVRALYLAHHATDGFINHYYDDEGWWALTWITAYDLTGDGGYLQLAQRIFANMTRGWTGVCGGGIYWAKWSPYKDAISNELFLQDAALLAALMPADPAYRRWAHREWHWLRHSRLIGPSGLVADGLTSNCRPRRGSPLFTYNQGGLIAGLVALHRVTHQAPLLSAAIKTAHAVLHSPALTSRGLLHEPCPPAGCGLDAPAFKGLFAQDLRLLYQATGDSAYQSFLVRNARSMWLHDRRGALFGLRWGGPFDHSDASRQISAAFLLLTQVTPISGHVPGP